MKKNCYRTFRAIALALLLTIETCLLPAANASAQEDNNASKGQMTEDSGVFGQGFEVEWSAVNKWDTGYNAEITLTNTGTETIHNWMLEFQTDDRITDLWNGTIHYQEGSIYRIKNAGILSFQKQAEENLYEIDSVITNAWETGYTMQISIENLSDAPIEHWALTFHFEKEIRNLWNAEIETRSDISYSIHNALNNSNIKPGEKVWFEFEAVTQNFETSFPEKIKLDMSCFEPDMGEDNTEEPEPDTEEPMDENTDYLDALYAYYGIDKDIEDNDKDGIPDVVEMLALGLNPAMPDSDGNGILDGDEDYDEDGLSNLLELELGCDPAEPDSDYDGLNDGGGI